MDYYNFIWTNFFRCFARTLVRMCCLFSYHVGVNIFISENPQKSNFAFSNFSAYNYYRKRPFYRIVAADSRSPRDGRFIELLGTYNPCTNPAQVNLKEEEILKWLNNGAQPSDTVKNLLSKQGIMKKFADSKQGK